MGEMITKPDTNPVLLFVLNALGLGGLGYLVIGQNKKAVLAFVIVLIGSTFTCGTLGLAAALVFAYDAFLLGQKLARGESIGETENGLPLLDTIFK